MTVSDQKLSEIEEALDQLGKDEEEVSKVLSRFEGSAPVDLGEVDSELEALGEGASIADFAVEPAIVVDVPVVEPESEFDEWESDKTEVEIIDSADDFVLLVEEDDLEELESASDDVPRVTVPPPLPGTDAASEEEEEDEGFFKKLFGSRRSSNRP